MVRDLEGRRLSQFTGGPSDFAGRSTDDRGVYRIYGLEPGVYLVRVTGNTSGYPALDLIEAATRETPTYYPSSTYDTAVEVTIRSGGEELSGIDVRQRSERGFVVSGTLTGEVESNNLFNAVGVGLRNPANGNLVAMTAGMASGKWAIYGVPNGEYEVIAFRSNESNDRAGSIPRRLLVRGADVRGIDVKLLRLGSIGGKVLIETAAASDSCVKEEPVLPEDVSLRSQRSEKGQGGQAVPVFEDFSMGFARAVDFSVPINKGDFVLKNLDAGQYRIIADLPGENYYVRSITQAGYATGKRVAGTTGTGIDVTRSGIMLRQGEAVAGVRVVIATGAASRSGRVGSKNAAQADTAAPARPRMRIHLIPAEATAAEDVQRYYEAITQSDNTFTFDHLAPGKYLLLGRPVAENEPAANPDRPLAWDATERANLRREAEGLKNEIELKPCVRVNNYLLRY